MSNFVLTLPLKTEIYQEDILAKRFEIGRKMYNAYLNELHKRYATMRQSKEYQKVCKMAKGKERNKQFQELNKKYGLTEYSLHTYVKSMQKHFKVNIDSFTAQKLATRCYKSFEGLMFHTADKVKYKPYGELNSLEGKSNETGIRYKDSSFIWNGLQVPINTKLNDAYAQKALQNKVKYCRIKREMIKGKYHYYLQLVLEGTPPIKVTSSGEIKGQIGSGKVGIDIGTQTIAISSQYDSKLLELAPEINNIDREIKRLQRKMDRSKRATNPNKYNENGTINTKDKTKWNFSNRYMKVKDERKELYRKQVEIRKQSHNISANCILNLGDEFYVEQMNYKGLQKRSKQTAVNEKTGKFNNNKRFGKSLANKAPSMFLTIMDNKLRWNGTQLYKIDTAKVKASQYNHMTDTYEKKELSERWNYLDGCKIQRDLYSAFLIMNVKSNLSEVDRDLCFRTFDSFKAQHDNEIRRLKAGTSKLISSMGIA